jgi:hypothetical protein
LGIVQLATRFACQADAAKQASGMRGRPPGTQTMLSISGVLSGAI